MIASTRSVSTSSNRGWIVALIAISFLVGLVWIGAFVLAASGNNEPFSFGNYEEEVLEDGSQDKIAMIDVLGEITSDASAIGSAAVDEDIVAQLDQALDDEDVVGLILSLDTPGGAVVASDVILDKVEEVRKAKVPVIALMEEVAASGGYYIASGANEIVANRSTITGSIGVIMIVPNLEGTSEKLGIKTITIKSGPHKDIASPLRAMTPEERQILQTMIDEAYGQFVSVVSKGRKIGEDEVRKLADGRIYSGRQAKDLHLVDHLGDRDLALSRARKLTNSPDATLVRYTRTVGLTDILTGFGYGRSVKQAVKEQTGVSLSPGLKYLWVP